MDFKVVLHKEPEFMFTETNIEGQKRVTVSEEVVKNQGVRAKMFASKQNLLPFVTLRSHSKEAICLSGSDGGGDLNVPSHD